MGRRSAIGLMVVSVVAVPVWFFVDAANDDQRDSNLWAIAGGLAFYAAVLVACFYAAISQAGRSRRLTSSTVAVVCLVVAAHTVAWWMGTRFDAGASVLLAYLGGGALATVTVRQIEEDSDSDESEPDPSTADR